jgi:hypothetical protein
VYKAQHLLGFVILYTFDDMRKAMIFVLLLLPFGGTAQDFISELENSMERKDGASGAKIEYKIHLNTSTIKTYYSTDFDYGKLYKSNDQPLYFELTKKKSGEEKEVVVLSVSEAILIEFNVTYPKGNCTYTFDFYY